MIYRYLKLGVLSLCLALGLFGSVSLFSNQTASAQSLGGNGIFLPLVANGAAETQGNTTGPFTIADEALYEKAVAEMEQNISIGEDGQLIYDGLVPLSADITPEIHKSLLGALDETNRALSSGEITLADLNWGDVSDAAQNDELAALGSCRGSNKITRHWWGVKVYINSCYAKRISYLQNLGSVGLSRYCKALPCKAIGYSLKGASWIVKYYNRNNTGVIVYMTPTGHIFRVKSQ